MFRKYVIFLLIIFIIGCSEKNVLKLRAERAAQNNKEIVIGVAWPLNDFSKTFKKGLLLALEEINSKISYKKINLILRDDKSDITTGIKIATEFAKNLDVIAVIGHQESYISLPTSTIYKNAGILQITPGSTDNEIINNNNPYIIRTIPSNSEFAIQAVNYAKKENYKNIIIYYINNSYGKSLSSYFEDIAEEKGITVVDRRSISSEYENNFSKDIEYWSYLDYDAVFLVSGIQNATGFIKELRMTGINKPVFGCDGFDNEGLISNGGEYVEGTVVISIFNPFYESVKTQEFVKNYKIKYNESPDMWAAQAYDALYLIYDAIKKTGSTKPSSIAEEIKKIENWEGVSGNCTFDINGEIIKKSLIIKKVNNGKFIYNNCVIGGNN